MFLSLYLLATGAAAGLLGVVARHFLSTQGFVPDFPTGVIVAAGAACTYIALQALYIAIVQLIAPTRSGGPLLGEALAQLAALAFVPFLLDIPVPAPLLAVLPELAQSALDKALEMAAIAVYGGLFLALHATLKLFAFYWFLQAKPCSRVILVPWLVLAAAGAAGAYYALNDWRDALVAARPAASGEQAPYRIGATYATAGKLAEGALLSMPFPFSESRHVTLRFANLPDASAPLDQVNVLIVPDSASAAPFPAELALEPNGWATLRIPAGKIPLDTQKLTISWAVGQDPVWLAQAGLRPVVRSGRELLVSGPYLHRPDTASGTPHVIVLLLEGVGAAQLHTFGYTRDATPAMDALAKASTAFANAFTVAPEVPAAAMTLLTGLTPLSHGYLGEASGPLPEGVKTLPELLRERGYLTAAFTEGDGPDIKDLMYGSGFERGFELFDQDFALEPSAGATELAAPSPLVPQGSYVTLDKAADLLEANRDTRVFLFVRLRELRTPAALPRYGRGYIQDRRNPRPIEVYDTALRALDEQLGAFFDRIDKNIGREHTAILLTSAYGFHFEPLWRATPQRGLLEDSLRVPLFIAEPGRGSRERSTLVGLEDAAASLFTLAGIDPVRGLDYDLPGRDALTVTSSREPVSVWGDPLQLSLRTRRWRFTWDSGIAAQTFQRATAEQPLALFDLEALGRGLAQGNTLRTQERLVEIYRNRLAETLGQAMKERGLLQATTPPPEPEDAPELDPSAPAI